MGFIRIASVCLATIFVISAVGSLPVEPPPATDHTNATVVNVIDGDTVVVVRDGDAAAPTAEVVRLLDVDAPEPDECGWVAATEYLEGQVLGARVLLEVGGEPRDRYGRTLAGVTLEDRLVNADIAAQGFGWPVLTQPDRRFYAAVSAAWDGPAPALTGSCTDEQSQEDRRTAATALDQNADKAMDQQLRDTAQTAWREYEAERTTDLEQAAAGLDPAEAFTISTASDLVQDPRTAKPAAFDHEETLEKQVRAAKKHRDHLVEQVEEFRAGLEHPSTHSAIGMGDERWVHVPPRDLAHVEADLSALTGEAKEGVKEASKALRQYRTLASQARVRAAAKARAVAALYAQTPSSANGYVRGPAGSRTVRVGTYNVCKSTCGKGAHSWSRRRTALVNEVRWADPDVLAVQEANTSRWHGVQQVDDVRRLLRPAGYEIASTRFTCTKGCTRGAHIFYKSSEMSLSTLPSGMSSAGMTSLSRIAQKGFGSYQDRAVSWAFLTPRGSKQPTLYVSVHLITEKTKRGESLRVATARRMDSFTSSLVSRSGLKGNVPIVVAGDFNSYARRQPHGAQAIMTASGFHDGYSAPVKVNASLGTVNHSPSLDKYKGFPPHPPRYESNTTRIDYVFSTVEPLRHEVVARLNSSGRFDDKYRASDHNMVLVDLPVG